jgi:hypothetical protein
MRSRRARNAGRRKDNYINNRKQQDANNKKSSEKRTQEGTRMKK